MHGDTEEARSRRARARARWPVVRYRLGEEPSDEVWAGLTPEERVRVMWSITVDAWILAGRSLRYIGRTAWIRNKEATGRPQDLADVERLRRRNPSR